MSALTRAFAALAPNPKPGHVAEAAPVPMAVHLQLHRRQCLHLPLHLSHKYRLQNPSRRPRLRLCRCLRPRSRLPLHRHLRPHLQRLVLQSLDNWRLRVVGSTLVVFPGCPGILSPDDRAISNVMLTNKVEQLQVFDMLCAHVAVSIV